MPIDFPSNPATGQSYTYGSKRWTWSGTGTSWNIVNGNVGSSGSAGSLTGVQGGCCVGLALTGSVWYRVPLSLGTISLGTTGTQYQPFWVNSTTTFDRIAVRTGTVTTSGTMVLGIYNDGTLTAGRPGTLLLNAGSVSYTANNTEYAITINQTLTRGWYWLASYVTGGSSTWRGYAGTAENYWLPVLLGDPSSDSIVTGYHGGTTFSNDPGLTTQNWARNAIFLRA